MSYYRTSKKSSVGKIVGLSVLAGLLIGFFIWLSWFNGAVIFRGLFTAGRGGWIFFIGIVLTLIAVTVSAISFTRKHFLLAALTFLTGVTILILLIMGWVRIGYDTDKQYVADLEVTKNQVDSYEPRAPYDVAVASASRNLQDTRGDVQATKSLADQSTNGTWNTLVVRRGFAQGYESLQTLDLPLYGSPSNSQVDLCKFDKRSELRLGGGFPHNNLDRAILNIAPLDVTFENDDVYGYCVDKTPYVVVPLKKVEGFYAPTWNVYGVALYNGKSGALKVYTQAKDIRKIPGPTYPISLAAQQSGALGATGDLWDYNYGRVGYDASQNNTEVQLRKAKDGRNTTYVTALCPKGASSSIVGFVGVDAHFQGQHRNKLVLNKLSGSHTYDAISTQEDNIKTSYANLTGWATGLEIFEVTPGIDGSWVASIGKSQSVLYRAVISEVKGHTVYKLYDKDGNLIPDATSGDAPTEGTPVQLPAGTELPTLSDEQLQQLGQEILKELGARASK